MFGSVSMSCMVAKDRQGKLTLNLENLENTKEQYAAVFKELDAAKQELRRIRHDCEAVIEEKTEAGREKLRLKL
ncbi:hypothetical protein Tco_1091424 [Tanacetum coccineum]|uniref:Uncharacterized protein n=1 Tax=Tanacetum coccineum TaxID=301880 RepID=A0ABQ5I852_9ASTR